MTEQETNVVDLKVEAAVREICAIEGIDLSDARVDPLRKKMANIFYVLGAAFTKRQSELRR